MVLMPTTQATAYSLQPRTEGVVMMWHKLIRGALHHLHVLTHLMLDCGLKSV